MKVVCDELKRLYWEANEVDKNLYEKIPANIQIGSKTFRKGKY